MEYDSSPFSSRIQKDCGMMASNSKSGIGKWFKRSCNDTYGYICQRKLDPSLPSSPDPTISTGYVQIFNDSIKVAPDKMNWKAAKEYCEKDGANLASLRNEWSNIYFQWLDINGKTPIWLGLNKAETGGYFKYVNGFHLNQVNWDSFEPRMIRDCVCVKDNGRWKTADCTQSMTVVCMKTTDVAPTVSADFPGHCPEDSETHRSRSRPNRWIPHKKYCYLFLTERSEWPDATASCIRHGASLLSIEDPDEGAFISSMVQTYKDSQSSFWIGLYKTHKGVWQWLDKTVVDYTNWFNGQQESSFGTYGVFDVMSGKWKAGSRWHEKGYICKVTKVIQTVPSTNATPIQQDPQSRGHKILVAMLIITAIVVIAVVIFFVFKKSGVRLAIPEKLTTFDNPLFFNTERHQAGVVDTTKLVANTEEGNSGSIITV